MTDGLDHSAFLNKALQEALLAEKQGEDPIGCVIVDAAGRVISYGHNYINRLGDPTAHAEMMAIRSAVPQMRGEEPRSWTLYTTLEPCPMCLGTIVMCHIGTLVWGADDPRKEGHLLLGATPYMRSRKMVVVPSPDPVLAQTCASIHAAYWVARGRPEMVEPIAEP